MARNTPLDLAHLEARMRRSGHLTQPDTLSEHSFRELLLKRIESVDLASAAADVRRFLAHPSAIDVWSPEFFVDLAHRIVTRP